MVMKYLRESSLVRSQRVTEKRKSSIGSFKSFNRDIFKQRIMTPHAEMEAIIEAREQNTFFLSAQETSRNFIMGEGVEFESDDDFSKKQVEQYWESLGGDLAFSTGIGNTISLGNGYVEKDFYDLRITGGILVPSKVYAIADPSQIYINSDEYGNPLRIKKINQLGEMKYEDDNEEFYIQKVNQSFRHPRARSFSLSYWGGGGGVYTGSLLTIYGIPIDKRKFTHFRLNVGSVGTYGRSQFASAINDHEMLAAIEKSIATIAKYKAVPRKFYQYGDEKMPATDDEIDELIVYLESLEPEEDAIVNKKVAATDMSYSGGEINLDYAIQHIKKKMVAGVTLDFLSGMGQDVNRATAQQELLAFILAIYSKRKFFLKPLQEEYIDPFIKWKGLKPVTIKFPVLDFETKSEKENRIRSNWMGNMITLNEMRKQMGLPELTEERKKEEAGEMLFGELQNSMLPDMGGGFDMGGFGGEEPQFGEESEGEGENLFENSTNPPESDDMSSPSFSASEGLKENPTGTRYLQNMLATEMRKVFRNRLKNILKDVSDNKNVIERKIVKEATLGIGALEMIMQGLKGVSQELINPVNFVIAKAWMKANSDIVNQIKFPGQMIPFDKRVMNIMAKNSFGFIEKYASGQEASLRLALTNGITQGDSISTISQEIREHFKLTAAKSEQIARTEVVKAYNQGARTSMQNAGVKKYKWVTAGDERVRHSHQLLNGREFEFGKKGTIPFKVNGKTFQIPRSPIPGQLGDASLDINCRCSIIAVPTTPGVVIPGPDSIFR